MPATLKRALAIGAAAGVVQGGVGLREYNDRYSQNVQDLVVQFQEANGREPNKTETDELMLRAGRETNTDLVLRFIWNAGSPAPATPSSRYSAIQKSWYQIQQQARAEGYEYEWAYEQFKEKWGEAYMPLIYSEAQNPANVTPTPSTVAGLKRYRGVLDRVDPTLTRMVLGVYADDDTEYSPEARNWLRSTRTQPGTNQTYYSYDDPRAAMEEQMARRGWRKYGELTASLTSAAQSMGLNSYRESDQLMALRSAGVAQIRAENWAFDKDWGTFDETEYDRYLVDMRTIVKSKALFNDPARQDVQVLNSYLTLRDAFVKILAAREAAGLGGVDAQAQESVRLVFTALVGKLVESNTQFEEHMYNGLIERDPLLVGD